MYANLVKLAALVVNEARERIWSKNPRSFSSHKNETGDKNASINDEKANLEDSVPHPVVSTSPKQPDDDFKLDNRLLVCFLALFTSTFVASMDYTSMGNLVSTISRDLHGSTTQSEWIGNGFALTSCVAQLPISTLSDIFGRRALLVFSLLMFLIGSIVCGTAQNMTAMISGRIIQGIGSAGIFVLPEVVMAETIPLRLRGVYYTVFMAVFAAGAAIGPIIAGAFAEFVTWRWMFYLNLPVCGVALVCTPFFRLKTHDQNWKQQLAQVDYVGAVLVIASSTSLILGLTRGGSSRTLPWNSWSVLVPLILGAVGLVVTGLYEYYANIPHPMFNVRVFGNVTAALCYIQNILQGIIALAATFYLPTFFQGAKQLGTLMSGVAILPLTLIGPPMSLVVGWLILTSGHYAAMNYFLWGLSTVGVALLTLMNEHKNMAMLICIQIPGSIGIMCLYATLSITVNASNPPELWVDSTAMMSFCRSIGEALGTAVGGAIFSTQMKQSIDHLGTDGLNISESLSPLTIANYIRQLSPGPLRDALVHAVARAMRTLFIVAAIFSAVGFASCFLQHEYSLEESYEPRQGIAEPEPQDSEQ